MVVITGYIDFPRLDRDELLGGIATVTEQSRRDEGCVDYWWAEDSEVPMRFRFFECWESRRLLDAHRAQPFETEFLERFVARCSGARAHTYDVTGRERAT